MPTTIGYGSAWIRRYHPSATARTRLVCFPHAGGAANFYFPLSAALTPAVDVLAVQYPGRQDRYTDPCVESIDELADRIFDALRGQDDAPTAFFGHSMGAIVAFEVARRLQGAGRPPALLIASGRRAPSRYRPGGVHRLDDGAMVAELRQLGGTDAQVLDDEELLPIILPAVRSDYKAIETYVYAGTGRLTCPITALVGGDDPHTTIEEVRAWDEHTAGDFSIRVFPGGHFYLNDHRAAIAELIDAELTRHAGRVRN